MRPKPVHVEVCLLSTPIFLNASSVLKYLIKCTFGFNMKLSLQGNPQAVWNAILSWHSPDWSSLSSIIIYIFFHCFPYVQSISLCLYWNLFVVRTWFYLPSEAATVLPQVGFSVRFIISFCPSCPLLILLSYQIFITFRIGRPIFTGMVKIRILVSDPLYSSLLSVSAS